jgi:hypothetical protein
MIRIIGAVLVTAVLGAPIAQADSVGDEVYLDGIHENYYSRTHTDTQWLAEARRICDAHLGGASNDQLFDMVQADLNVPDNVAADVVGGLRAVTAADENTR